MTGLKNLSLLVAVFSLFLAAPAAGETAAQADDSPGVWTFFGKRFCLPSASPDAICDWRVAERVLPGHVSGDGLAADHDANTYRSFTLFGSRWCLGGDSKHCDVNLPTEIEPQPRYLRLFGMNVCFGDVLHTTRCDVRIPPDSVPRESQRASL